jgi:enoyl-CoA hydratase/carnithine racemase
MGIMSEPILRFENANGIAILTLNHPEKRNALSRAMLQSLLDELRRIADDRSVRVVIIRAAGTVFSSGHDLRELTDAYQSDHASLFGLCTEVMESIRKLSQPVVAQVQGLATAAGCQLVATCDLAIASEKASFATPGVKIGLFCTTPGVAVSRAVPAKKAMEMLLTGAAISAAEAERCGLVTRVVAPERLAVETMELARQIAQSSAGTIALGKKAFYAQLPLDRPAAYALAQKVMTENAAMPDAQEGIHAFLEKRTPQWKT